MKNIQFIKVNEDSTIKVEYLKTEYIDIPNPDNLKGLDLMNYIVQKISEVESQNDFLDPEEGILDTLEIPQEEITETTLDLPELRKW